MTPQPEEKVPDWVGAQVRSCQFCSGVDNHPRVQFVQAVDNALMDAIAHYDCYAAFTKDPKIVSLVDQAHGSQGHELRVALFGDPDTGQEPTISAKE